MKMFRLFGITVFFLLTTMTGWSVQPKDDRKKDDDEIVVVTPVYEEGMVYSLPRIGFEIKVKAKRKVHVPGPYAAYAEKYLGIKNAPTTPETTWHIEGIKVGVFSEADPNAIFKTKDTLSFPIAVLANGVLSGINTNGINSGIEINGNDFIAATEPTITFNDLSSDDYYDLLIDTETGTETMSPKTLETKAREAADYLIRLRKKRAYTILDASDVVPEDGKGYEVFVNEAMRLEKIYTELFTGKTKKTKHTYTFNFIPGNNNVKNEVLFRFSEEKGIVAKSDLSGKPILLTITQNSNASNSAKELKATKNPNSKQLFYRIPVSANVEITDGINTIYSGTTVVPQFGELAPVPENLLNGDFSIEFNTESGTIKAITEY